MIRYYLAAGAFVLLLGAMAIAFIGLVTGPEDAKITIGVQAIDGYGEETKAAMSIWNGFVGCKFLVPGDDTLVKSDDGEPCGDAMRPEEEWGHAATAYDCKDGHYEILISQPGNTNTQACIIAHELGHRLGMEHATIGVMGHCSTDKQNVLRIRDADVAALRKDFCHE